MTTVLMTTDAVGGVWTYTLDLAVGLAEDGVDVVLVVMGPPPTAGQRAQLAATPVVEAVVLDAPVDGRSVGAARRRERPAARRRGARGT